MALQLHFHPEHSDLRCWLLTPGTCYLLSPVFSLGELLLSCATWLQPGKRPGHRDLSTLQVFLPSRPLKKADGKSTCAVSQLLKAFGNGPVLKSG